MKSITFIILFAILSSVSNAQETVKVGGEETYPKRDIVSNAVNSNVHTTLVAAVKAADLVETLQGEGPFTVFAPVNDAFENLPEGTVKSLLQPSNKEKLQAVLTYHVIPGNYDFDKLSKWIRKNDGKLALETVQGNKLYLTQNGKHNIQVWDEQGNAANISVYDVHQSNGVIHQIDAVLMP